MLIEKSICFLLCNNDLKFKIYLFILYLLIIFLYYCFLKKIKVLNLKLLSIVNNYMYLNYFNFLITFYYKIIYIRVNIIRLFANIGNN